ncbi:ATP-dependent RNA helicase-like protein DB10 [Salvia splendens]|uniref:ATP-dependent RNA helicase-like protein DB10 n=1 Tax=Salvia splendens TaxID=180675 RepID=UPI001C270D40|nr:ATP-dependent RNA helicase-like protein DB10 [Salvia splendens]
MSLLPTPRKCGENLYRQLGAAAIHGDKCQGERDHVATDVAARGLDVKDIRYCSGWSFGHDSNATGSFHQKSFHESMMAASNNKDRSRSRSRSRCPHRNSE